MDEWVTHYYGNQTTTSTNISSTKATWFNNLSSNNWATVTFEALWTINQYTATILAEPSGYGTVSPASVKKDYNSNITISGNTITIWWTTVTATPSERTAQYTYIFSGWVNNCGDKLTWDCTITAQFDRTVNQYTVTVTATPAEWAESLSWGWILNYGDPLRVSVKPALWRHVVAYTVNGVRTGVSNVGCNQNFSIIVQWWITWNFDVNFELNSCDYTIIFLKNGWTGTMEHQILTYDDEPVALNKNEFTKDWYTFTWWSKTSTWEVLYRDQELVRNLLERWTTVRLYAVWELDNYTITYNLNWWTNNANNPSTYTIESWDITLQSPTRVWYTFLWWTWSNGDTAQTWVIIPAWSYGDKTYNAVWQANVYNINYNLNDGTHGASYSDVATYDMPFTVSNPTRIGYTFIGWSIAWMNEWVIHTYGNQTTTSTSISSTMATWFNNLNSNSWATVTFEAVWSANTNTQYIVYHYVKIVWQSGYALSKTETLYGTSDEVLTLSSLAKESEFMCAHYSSWSLSWTGSWPWPIVTQTTINGDGSTKIYLYYIRNYHTVYLTGDEHVERFIMGWVETDEAVRECGSEVPVQAIPKPWYHFVKWEEREEKEEKKEDDDEMNHYK